MLAAISIMMSLAATTMLVSSSTAQMRSNTKQASQSAAINAANDRFEQAYNKSKMIPGSAVSVTEPYVYQDGFRTKTGYVTKEDEI